MHDTILNPKFIFEVMDCPPMTCPTRPGRRLKPSGRRFLKVFPGIKPSG